MELIGIEGKRDIQTGGLKTQLLKIKRRKKIRSCLQNGCVSQVSRVDN